MRTGVGVSWILALLGLALSGCAKEPRRELFEHGRFEPMPLTVPASPRSLALLLAGAAERELGDALSAHVVRRGGIVARVDAEAFARVLDATPSGCVFPSGDLDNLAHNVQAYLTLPSYQPAILIGLGVGAGLVAGALTQAPPNTFAGALAFDFCGQSSLHVPLCPRDAARAGVLAATSPSPGAAGAPGAASQSPAVRPPVPPILPDPMLADPLLRLRSRPGALCAANAPAPYGAAAPDASAFEDAFATLAEAASARATSGPTDMADMPISEVLTQSAEHADTFGVLLSGDGGWAGLDREVSARLSERGVPIVGVDSLRYFWTARSPEGTAADLERVIQRYQAAWQRPRVVLIGYSQGADVLPFILNRLPERTRTSVVVTVALALSTTATFEFHVRNWVGASGDRPTLPEVDRLAPGSLLCVYGKADGDALCPQLDASVFGVLQLPGDHHFNGDYDRLSNIVLDALSRYSGPRQ